ncbi:hypothetical protein BaRGS_00006611 [Batillaria attramentaria]|uniref:Uncharacterized protein n=1 Tax=Batillaria attramentaria TaxID=370345 RepID=A0ABD0LS29_9CAEN
MVSRAGCKLRYAEKQNSREGWGWVPGVGRYLGRQTGDVCPCRTPSTYPLPTCPALQCQSHYEQCLRNVQQNSCQMHGSQCPPVAPCLQALAS